MLKEREISTSSSKWTQPVATVWSGPFRNPSSFPVPLYCPLGHPPGLMTNLG